MLLLCFFARDLSHCIERGLMLLDLRGIFSIDFHRSFENVGRYYIGYCLVLRRTLNTADIFLSMNQLVAMGPMSRTMQDFLSSLFIFHLRSNVARFNLEHQRENNDRRDE